MVSRRIEFYDLCIRCKEDAIINWVDLDEWRKLPAPKVWHGIDGMREDLKCMRQTLRELEFVYETLREYCTSEHNRTQVCRARPYCYHRNKFAFGKYAKRWRSLNPQETAWSRSKQHSIKLRLFAFYACAIRIISAHKFKTFKFWVLNNVGFRIQSVLVKCIQKKI